MSDFAFLPKSLRRGLSSDVPSTSEAPASPLTASDAEADLPRKDKTAENDNDAPLPALNASPSRPSLLRASRTTQVSHTAVNLSSGGGITLHISSVGKSPFVWEDEGRGTPVAHSSSMLPLNLQQKEAHRPVRDLFDLMLPREIRIACFEALVQLHEEEVDQMDLAKRNSSLVVGRAAATRELIRLSRVSKTWQSLVLDGQLWSEISTSALPNMSAGALLRVTRTAGPFVKRIDLRNMKNLTSELLVSIATPPFGSRSDEHDSITRPLSTRVRAPSAPRLPTSSKTALRLQTVTLHSLTHLNLQGPRATISTDALHRALIRMPQLRQLNLGNNPAVNDETCLLLGACTPELRSLNINRCRHASANGIMLFVEAAQICLGERALLGRRRSSGSSLLIGDGLHSDHIALPLEELRAIGLRNVDAVVMETMGRAFRSLQVLDLSYAAELRDDAIEAFVRHPGPDAETISNGVTTPPWLRPTARLSAQQRECSAGTFVVLTPREAGGDIFSDEPHYRRLHSSLQHLALSACRGLTDRLGMHLAHTVPHLQSLELANIGANIREPGMIKLLETTPEIQRLDVENAFELGRAFARTITPPKEYVESLGLSVSQDDGGSDDETQQVGLARQGRARSVRIARRTLSPRTQHDRLSRGDENVAEPAASSSISNASVWRRPAPTGSQLSHLVLSHITRIPASDLLTLVRHCPKLTHIEVDDTRANDALLNEFVLLARKRHKKGAFVSLVDCRHLSKESNSDVFSRGNARARNGQIGSAYSGFLYEGNIARATRMAKDQREDDGVERSGPTLPSSLNLLARRHVGNGNGVVERNRSGEGACIPNDFDENLVVVKSFWGWQAVDERVRAWRKTEAKRVAAQAKSQQQQSRSRQQHRQQVQSLDSDCQEARTLSPFARIRRSDSLGAALQFISGSVPIRSNGASVDGAAGNSRSDAANNAEERWAAPTTGLLGPGHEAEDARGCTIM